MKKYICKKHLGITCYLSQCPALGMCTGFTLAMISKKKECGQKE